MIERLNERITIEKNTAATDVYANHFTEWTEYYSCACRADTAPKATIDESQPNAVVYDERMITFEVRYCTELKNIDSTNYRVVFRGENWNIVYVDMMNWAKKFIRLRCEKELR